MKTIPIPYYTSTLDLHVEEKNLKAIITAKMHEFKPGKSEEEIVREALENPIGTPRLCELAKGRKRVVLVTSDHTRAVPSKLTLPILLEEIRRGNPEADITILIATGLHRATTEEEQRRMFGDAIVDHEKIAINDAFDPEQFVHVCTLPSGADFNVNRLAVDCDLLVTARASSSRTSSPASPAGARASCPASATPAPSTRTTATRPSPIPIRTPACWRATPSTRTWSAPPAR